MLRQSVETVVRTSKGAPHTVVLGEEFVSHNAVFEYFKKSVKWAEKEIDREAEFLRNNATRDNYQWLIKYTNILYNQLTGQLKTMGDLNIISDTKYKWWQNYLWREIEWRYDNIAIELGL